jgi:serine O-acetyltransferase
MVTVLKRLQALIARLRALPAMYLIARARERAKIDRDIDRWAEILQLPANWECRKVRVHLLATYPEFRNLLAYRLRGENPVVKALAFRLLRPVETLTLDVVEIGGGLFIQHGFATIVSAERIGDNCWLNQQVTIGHVYDRGRPTIGDRVTVAAGAVIVGPVVVGNDVTIGANATVVKDVPPSSVVVGPPMRVLTRVGTAGGHLDPRLRVTHLSIAPSYDDVDADEVIEATPA